MCELTGMDVSNASVYDVGTAVGEAMIMACEKKSKVLVLGAVNPETVAVAKTYAYASGFKLVEIPHKNGLADLDALEKALDDNTACVVAQSPNFFGLFTYSIPFPQRRLLRQRSAARILPWATASLWVCRLPSEALIWESSPATPR